MRNIAITVLIAMLAFTGWRLGDVERQRYTMLTGLCDEQTVLRFNATCLASAEPRTSRLWDIFYGLFP